MEYDKYESAIEVAPSIWWVGYNTDFAWSRSNPYLIVEGDEAALIDPGSMLDFNTIKKKAARIKGGTFCAVGGSKEPLGIGVRVVY